MPTLTASYHCCDIFIWCRLFYTGGHILDQILEIRFSILNILVELLIKHDLNKRKRIKNGIIPLANLVTRHSPRTTKQRTTAIVVPQSYLLWNISRILEILNVKNNKSETFMNSTSQAAAWKCPEKCCILNNELIKWNNPIN